MKNIRIATNCTSASGRVHFDIAKDAHRIETLYFIKGLPLHPLLRVERSAFKRHVFLAVNVHYVLAAGLYWKVALAHYLSSICNTLPGFSL